MHTSKNEVEYVSTNAVYWHTPESNQAVLHARASTKLTRQHIFMNPLLRIPPHIEKPETYLSIEVAFDDGGKLERADRSVDAGEGRVRRREDSQRCNALDMLYAFLKRQLV